MQLLVIYYLPLEYFTKLRGFHKKSSITAEEVYLRIWRVLTQILTWHIPSVGIRGGCFPWPMIALVRYCWLGRDIVNSTTKDDNGQRWRSSRQNSHGHRERVCATLVADNVKAARPWKWSKSTLSQLSHPTLRQRTMSTCTLSTTLILTDYSAQYVNCTQSR